MLAAYNSSSLSSNRPASRRRTAATRRREPSPHLRRPQCWQKGSVHRYACQAIPAGDRGIDRNHDTRGHFAQEVPAESRIAINFAPSNKRRSQKRPFLAPSFSNGRGVTLSFRGVACLVLNCRKERIDRSIESMSAAMLACWHWLPDYPSALSLCFGGSPHLRRSG